MPHNHLTAHRIGRLYRIEPWGPDALRVRVSPNPRFLDTPDALLNPATSPPPKTRRDADTATLTHGRLHADLDPDGRLTISDTQTDRTLLADHERGHDFLPLENARYQLTARFQAFDDERLFGMGQHQHGRLDQKGCTLELRQLNTQVAIPLLISNRGYAFLWNHPGTGTAHLAHNRTEWLADRTPQLDFWIAAGDTPADLMARYAQATGHPPMMPEWAAGFWQCKLRYQTENELLDIAQQFKDRGLPLAALVIDYFHWTRMGDWKFDENDWPNPAAMVQQLRELGVEPVVSVWPTVNMSSENADALRDQGLLVRGRRGGDAVSAMADKPTRNWQRLLLYDATHPAARDFLWARIKAHYLDQGIRAYWLDACEPEVDPPHHDNLLFHAGPGDEVACRYPLDHQRAFFDGLTAAGETHVVTLCRSAWAGSQRYGAIVWSGDIHPTWDALRASVRTGLNMALSGIPWWNTDIGGFKGGDPDNPDYRELLTRWFQYGTLCPIMRLHGNREPRTLFTGGPNEPWSFGPDTEAILTQYLHLRTRLQPYILEQMQTAHRTGTPPMRPVWFDHPQDPNAWPIDDQYLFGPDLLVAPVLQPDATTRDAYLPTGHTWTDPWTNTRHDGGQTVTLDAPLDRLPLLLRDDAQLPIVG